MPTGNKEHAGKTLEMLEDTRLQKRRSLVPTEIACMHTNLA